MGYLVSNAGPRPGSGVDCPEENSLARFAESDTPPEAREGIEGHLAGCEDCRAVVAVLALDPGEKGASRGDAPATVVSGADRIPGPPPAEPAYPRTFGPYSIVRLLGSGGMGVVYEARHSQRQRPEALKVLKGGLGSVPEMAERFQREVRAMAGVSHDHVVPLFDSGCVGEDLYYTMPLLPGAALAEVIREIKGTGERVPGPRAMEILDRARVPAAPGSYPTPEAAYVQRVAAALVGVADALATLHERGILHRDLKPGNLMVDGQGRVVVTDFGLVRWNDQRITRTGQNLGTPAYMSPEQVISDGHEPDGRMDIYALGATLHELLTLRLPHEGDTGLETIRRKLAARAAPVRSLNPAVPRDLETLVGRCLERRREDRYASASALRDDLARFSRGEAVRARPVSPLARARNYVLLHRVPMAAAAAVLALSFGWWWTRPALLTVSTIPPARLLVDGQEIGTTPVAAWRLAPGDHEIRIEHPKFAPFVRRISAERGSTYEMERGLQALDPADPETLRIVAAAAGLQVTGVEVAARRGAEAAPFTVLFPRGAVREAPREARLWADEVAEGYRAVLERVERGTASAIAEIPVPPSIRKRVLAIPEAARARMQGGGTYRIRLVASDGRESSMAEFRLLDPATRGALDAALERLGKRFEEGDPVAEFLRIETLLGYSAFEEAYERTVTLGEKLGPRKEVARTALAILDRAGLRERGWWTDWSGLYLAEGK